MFGVTVDFPYLLVLYIFENFKCDAVLAHYLPVATRRENVSNRTFSIRISRLRFEEVTKSVARKGGLNGQPTLAVWRKMAGRRVETPNNSGEGCIQASYLTCHPRKLGILSSVITKHIP